MTVAIAPHLGSPDAPGQSPKAVAKTLKKLAKHLTKQQRAADKTANSPKRARKALTGELMTSLHDFLVPAGEATAELPKAVTKTIKRLAAQLDKDRRKQAKRAAKAARAEEQSMPDAPTASAAPKRPTARKAAPTKAAPAKAE